MSWLNPAAPVQATPVGVGDPEFGNSTFLRPSDSNFSKLGRSTVSSSSSSVSASQQSSFVQKSLSQSQQYNPVSNSQNQPIQQSQQTQPQQPSPGTSPKDPPNKRILKSVLLFFDVFFSVLVSATGALGIGASKSINDSSTIFVGLYLILFSGILVFQDCMTICKIKALETLVKKNFGFLYGPIGKGCYFIFIALLVFGITKPKALVTGTGIVTGLYGIFYIFLSMALPDYFDKQEKYTGQ